MVLETQRLILRPARASDAPVWMEMWCSPFVQKYNCMKPPTLEEAQKRVNADIQAAGKAFYLERKSDGAFVGTVNLDEDSLRYQANSLMLEYSLGEAYAGQGYMTEALSAVVDYAFDRLGVALVSARVFGANIASRRVLEKLGFTQEGTIRRAVLAPSGILYDDMIFSLLREEWQGQREKQEQR